MSRPTTEANFVSLSLALFSEALPCQELGQMEEKLNSVSRTTTKLCWPQYCKGYSPKLRHLSKTHRIKVASTFNAITENTDIRAEHVDTACQKADIMTRGLAGQKWVPALDLFHFSRKALPSCKEPETSHEVRSSQSRS